MKKNWFKAFKAAIKAMIDYEPSHDYLLKDERKSSIITDVVGFNEPIQCITEVEVPCACRNCGTQWRNKLTNVYAVKNSIYMYDYCSKCVDMTNAVNRMMKYHKKIGSDSNG